MNHRVHSCIRGCLTLKLSLSWKTVICSSPDLAAPFALPSKPESGLAFSSAGEMGIVSRGTGESGLCSVISAMVRGVSM